MASKIVGSGRGEDSRNLFETSKTVTLVLQLYRVPLYTGHLCQQSNFGALYKISRLSSTEKLPTNEKFSEEDPCITVIPGNLKSSPEPLGAPPKPALRAWSFAFRAWRFALEGYHCFWRLGVKKQFCSQDFQVSKIHKF